MIVLALKFVKYYGSLQPEFVIAHILDPRVKTRFVDTLQDLELKQTFNNTIRSSFEKWFKGTDTPNMEEKVTVDYDTQYTIDQLRGQLNYNSLIAALSHDTLAKGNSSNIESTTPASIADDLHVYLQDPIEPYLMDQQPFDILQWWRKNAYKYPKLAPMVSLFLGREHSIRKVLFYITICLFILF